MASVRSLLSIPVNNYNLEHSRCSVLTSFSSPAGSFVPNTVKSTTSCRLDSIPSKSKLRSNAPRVKVNPQDLESTSAVDAFTHFKHILLPITDRNPYLSEGTRQAAATTAALAKKYGADITVVVIDEKQKESLPEHDTQLSSIRWHLSEGGYKEFKILEKLGEGRKPTAIIGEVADDLNLDLVVISMESIHSKHVDANLLAEFIPCPVLLLPL